MLGASGSDLELLCLFLDINDLPFLIVEELARLIFWLLITIDRLHWDCAATRQSILLVLSCLFLAFNGLEIVRDIASYTPTCLSLP